MTISDHEFSRRAHQVIPGGAHTYSRGDDVNPATAPRGFVRGKGARVWDVDGREFVDWGMGIGNVLIGHAEEEIDEAAISALLNGQAFSRPTLLEVEAAEAILELFPAMEMVKFAKNGSDSNTAAIRLARAITSRDMVAYDGSAPFLGIHDWFIGSTPTNAGVPAATRRLSVPFVYNDLGSLERLFAEHPGQIAAVIMEVCRERTPLSGFLPGVRDLCTRHDALLIFDEIVSGFRYSIHGAYSLFGVTPDLVALGKGMANGYALSALLGKREYMERGGLRHTRERVFLLSTTNGPEQSALAACLAVIRFFKQHEVPARLAAVGQQIMDAINAAAGRHGISEYVVAQSDFACRPVLVCSGPDRCPSLDFKTLFAQEMARGGVFMNWICPSFRFGDSEMDLAAVALDDACTVYAQAIEVGSVSGRLIGPAVKRVFRKYN